MRSLKVGYFPYRPIDNPYQRLFAGSLERAGVEVERIAPRKWFPLQHAASRDMDLLQLDWPHDWYEGRNVWTRSIKRTMYADGLRRLRRIPVVWTAHNLSAHDSQHAAYDQRMIQALVDVCDAIIVLSQASGDLLRACYRVPGGIKVEVIHHGHYIGCYANSISRETARERLGLAGRGRVVVSLGRLQPYKGVEELLEAFVRVARPGDALLVAGRAATPMYSTMLRQRIAGLGRSDITIELRDAFVGDDELQVYFNACDVVALPFRQVLNSSSLLLAMSFGCPVVAPRLGSIPEVACPEGWFGYDADVPDALSAALEAALDAPDLTARRERILRYTVARYDWGAAGAMVAALYRSILGRSSPGRVSSA